MNGFVIISEEMANAMAEHFNMKIGQINDGIKYSMYDQSPDELEDAEKQMEQYEEWSNHLGELNRHFSYEYMREGMGTIRLVDIMRRSLPGNIPENKTISQVADEICSRWNKIYFTIFGEEEVDDEKSKG